MLVFCPSFYQINDISVRIRKFHQMDFAAWIDSQEFDLEQAFNTSDQRKMGSIIRKFLPREYPDGAHMVRDDGTPSYQTCTKQAMNTI